MRRPNLFVIGAMKAGTTSLHRYLGAHPAIFMSEPKEPNYFVAELNRSRGEPWYLGLFAAAGEARIIGESSTEYSKLPTYQGVAERIHGFNPEARVVYLMRDPVARIVSHYWHNVQDLADGPERRDLLTAVRDDPRYLAYSDYATQLVPYLERFGKEQIRTLTSERLASDPEGTLRELLGWLDVAGMPPSDLLAARWNVRPLEGPSPRGWGLLSRLRRSAAWSRVRRAVPIGVRDLALRAAERRVPLAGTASEEALDYLRPRVLPGVEALSRLLGRDFPEWTLTSGRETPPSVGA